jgi:hypothetical protein
MTRSKSTPLDLLQTMMRASISQPNCSLMRVSLSPLVVMLHPTFSNGGAPSLTQCNWYCRTRYGRSFSVNSYRLTSDVDPRQLDYLLNLFRTVLFHGCLPSVTLQQPLVTSVFHLRCTCSGKLPGENASSEVQRSPRVCPSSNTLAPQCQRTTSMRRNSLRLTLNSHFFIRSSPLGRRSYQQGDTNAKQFRGDIFVNYPQLGYFIDGFFTPALQLRF